MRTFEIVPDRREALQLSAALWVSGALFAGTGAIIAGHIRHPGEYVTLLTGLLSALTIAYGIFSVLSALAGGPRWRALIILPLTVAVAAALQSVVDYGWFHVVKLVLPSTRLPAITPEGWLQVGFYNMCLYSANLALMWVSSANRALRMNAVLLAKAEADHLRSELHALRLKLDPHFMFNALNAATDLVASGRGEEAEEMLIALSTFLRSTFDIGVDDILLRDELSIVSEYLAVEAVRFPDRLGVRIECDAAAEDAMVPSFLLQPIAENAVKHGVAPSERPVMIRVSARRDGSDLVVRIENDGALTRSRLGGAGVGLSATRARILMRYGEDGQFDAGPFDGGYRVHIRIPFRSRLEGADHRDVVADRS